FFIIHIVLGIFMFFNGSHIDQIDRYFSYKAIQERFQPKNDQNQQPAQSQPSAPLLEFGGTESGKIRRYVWEAAITAWRSTQKTFFIGTGTETFAFAFFQHKPVEHNLTSEWDFLYNKAHNEYLNYLATTGIFGLLAYLSFLSMVTIKNLQYLYFVKSDHSKNRKEEISLTIALICGWTSLLITNFFGFSVVITQLFLFLFPAFILVIQNNNQERHFSISLPRIVGNATGVVGTIIGTVGILFVGVMWISDYFFAKGYRLSRAGRLTEGYIQLVQATSLRPREPLYYDELSLALGSLAVASMEAGNATAASELAEKSLLASNIALSIAPNNVNFWKTRTKIYFGFADLDIKFVEAAKNSLAKAQALSPNDPKISYNLAVLDGRLGNNEQAVETLKKTIAMKPNYRDPYYALYVFYKEVNQPNLATSVIKEYLQNVDPNDQEFQNLLKQ
ncbi:MAG: O-antigen ligase family protein, partial [Patescibacteria group bacterium]|nr:O-antigen ligase family protein [Patescibacteria group bacterium]